MIKMALRDITKLKGWFLSALERYASLFGIAAGLAVACLAVGSGVWWMEHRACDEYGQCLTNNKIKRYLGRPIRALEFGSVSMLMDEPAISIFEGIVS